MNRFWLLLQISCTLVALATVSQYLTADLTHVQIAMERELDHTPTLTPGHPLQGLQGFLIVTFQLCLLKDDFHQALQILCLVLSSCFLGNG